MTWIVSFSSPATMIPHRILTFNLVKDINIDTTRLLRGRTTAIDQTLKTVDHNAAILTIVSTPMTDTTEITDDMTLANSISTLPSIIGPPDRNHLPPTQTTDQTESGENLMSILSEMNHLVPSIVI